MEIQIKKIHFPTCNSMSQAIIKIRTFVYWFSVMSYIQAVSTMSHFGIVHHYAI